MKFWLSRCVWTNTHGKNLNVNIDMKKCKDYLHQKPSTHWTTMLSKISLGRINRRSEAARGFERVKCASSTPVVAALGNLKHVWSFGRQEVRAFCTKL
jgi:hypothetical protein